MNPIRWRRVRLVLLAMASLGVGALLGWRGTLRPSDARAWSAVQARAPEVAFADSLVHVRNVRDFDFRTADDFTPRWRERTYNLNRLDRAWLVLSPFDPNWRGPAHAFLSFGFSDGTYVTVSVEARRESGETYGMAKGLLRQFELMYVVAEERDAIGLRAVAWGDPVHLYPIRADPAAIRAVFAGMMRRADALRTAPEFYHTFSNNCTTNILDAVNAVAARRIPYGPRILLPGYLDEVAYARGLIDTDLPLEDARAAFRVNERARAAWAAGDFSRAIRE